MRGSTVAYETLAVEVLFDAVVARFAAEGTNAANTFGWREPEKHVEGSRIAWVPGDPTGRIGLTGPARFPGRNPRSLGTLRELFTCVISSSDPTDPENERAQYKATRILRDLWFRAVYKAAHGTFAIRDEQWVTRRNERRHGTALRVVVELESMIPDGATAQATAPVDTAASITVTLKTSADSEVVVPPDGEVDTGEGGASGATETFTAGENISALRVVRFEAGTENGVVLARPPEAESLAPVGVSAQAAGAGDEIVIVTDGGELSDPSWAWTPGAPVLLAELGTLTQTASPSLPFVLVIGVAIATDTIVVRIEPAIFTA